MDIFSFVRSKIMAQSEYRYDSFQFKDWTGEFYKYDISPCYIHLVGYEEQVCNISCHSSIPHEDSKYVSIVLWCDACAREMESFFPEKQTFLQRDSLIRQLDIVPRERCMIHPRKAREHVETEHFGYCIDCYHTHITERNGLVARAFLVGQLGLVGDVCRNIIAILLEVVHKNESYDVPA
jgi:hypothetical protein